MGNETRCIDEEIPFDVPDSWEFCRLNFVCWLGDGEKLTGEPLPYLEAKYLRGKSDATILNSGKVVNPNTKVILVDGENSGEVFDITERGYIGSTFKTINIAQNIYERYIQIVLEFYKNLFRDSKIGAAIPHLNKRLFHNLIIAIPPLSEQKRIIDKLNTITPLLLKYLDFENKEVQLEIEFPERLKKSILQYAIQGTLVAQNPSDEPASVLLDKIRREKEQLLKTGKIKKDKSESVIFKNTADNSYYESRNGKVLCIDDEIPFKIPNSWEWVRLGSITQHNTGKTLDKGRNKGILQKYITTSNLYWGYFDLSELREMPFEIEELDRCTASKGDLLICEGGEAGRSAIWYFENSICFQNHIHRVRPYANISSEYLLCYMEKIYRTGEINIYRKGVGIQSLSGNSLASILIPLPPINEQNRIVEKIKLLFAMLS
ncbi:MAG: restriction endonuclease subunit S [Tannerella sp.]|jgi:type I restriction enzyme S subunit|nr:restriction endonuclease subunit S [Tannerella sp.]